MLLMAMLLTAGCCQHSDTLKITDMGARGDCVMDNAEVINAALDSCFRLGGGTVVVPPGRFMSSTIYLKPGVALELMPGAEIVASQGIDAYGHYVTDRDMSRYDSGNGTANQNCAADTIWTKALIIARHADGASLRGAGKIDGGHLVNPLGEEGMRGPHAVLVAETDGFTMSDISIDRASNYAVLGYELKNCRFHGLTITQGWDGIHIRGGEDILIDSCCFSTGDDCIAGGRWRNMEIRGCSFNSSCNGIRMIMPSDNVDVSGCSFNGPGRYPHRTGSDKGGNMLYAVNIEPGAWGDAPGTVSGIHISNCTADNVMAPFSMTLQDDNHCTDVSIDGYEASDCWGMALSVKSWTSAFTDTVRISNSSFSFIGIPDDSLSEKILSMPFDKWPYFPSYGAYFRNVSSVLLDNVSFTTIGPDTRPDVYTDNVRSLVR